MGSRGKRAGRKHKQKQGGENQQLLHRFSSRLKLSMLVSGDERRTATDVRLLPEMVESLRIASIISETASPATFAGIRNAISHTPAIWDTGCAESIATGCPPRFTHSRGEVAHSMPVAQTETSSPDNAGLARKRKLGRAASSVELDRIARACPCVEPSTVKMAGAVSCMMVCRKLDWPEGVYTAISRGVSAGSAGHRNSTWPVEADRMGAYAPFTTQRVSPRLPVWPDRSVKGVSPRG